MQHLNLWKFKECGGAQTSKYGTCKKTDLTNNSLLPNGLVFMQNTYSSSCTVVDSTTEYNFVIGSKINKKQFHV